MGSVEPYRTEDGRRYRVRYRDPDRRSKEKGGFLRKIDAEEYLASVTVAAARGEYVDPGASRATISELGSVWLANQTHLKPSSFRPVEIAWRLHVEPRWGRRRVGDIRHSEVQTWVSEMTRDGKRSATTVIRAFGVLAGILDVATRDRRIPLNPARGVNLPRKGKKRRAYLTHQQVRLLASNSRDKSTLVYFLAYTGLRWGEATGLRIENVDALRRRVLVAENAVNVGSQLIVGTPKSHESRSVPFPQFLLPLIEAERRSKGSRDLLFGNGLSHLRPSNSNGGWFNGAVARSRAIDPTFPELSPHDLRHTAASLAISAGANVKAVQRMLGHASAAMTLDVYGDLFEDDLDAVSVRLDTARSESFVGDSWGLGPDETGKAPESQ